MRAIKAEVVVKVPDGVTLSAVTAALVSGLDMDLSAADLVSTSATVLDPEEV